MPYNDEHVIAIGGQDQTKWHELKTDPEVFAASFRGDKPYEIRFNDREFKPCDYLVLRETRYSGEEMRDGQPLEYTGRVLVRCITHLLSGYGVKEGWVILGVKEI